MSRAPITLTNKLRLVLSIYFAQAALAADADALLAESDFGRAHHRVIVFVGLNPGITVGELLRLLRIRGQSLNPVLSQLIREGVITQTMGEVDRRQRHLHLTSVGAKLHRRAAAPQMTRIERAFSRTGPDAVDKLFGVLEELMDPADREYMTALAENRRERV